MEEQFLDVANFNNYEISNHGRVRNKQTGRFLSPRIRSGYFAVTLFNNGENKTLNIHRLVATAFCENPNNYNIVDHINRLKLDNRPANLRFCTSQENNRNQSKRKDNVSGVSGIDFRASHNSWIARIVDNNNKRITKSFSTNKYHNARTLALLWRRQKEVEFGYTNE